MKTNVTIGRISLLKRRTEGFIMTKIRAAIALLIVVGALIMSAGALADTEGDYEYDRLSDGTARVTKYSGDESNVTVPATLGGLRVSTVGYDAFSNASVNTVVIPEGVTTLEEESFAMCGYLTRIDLPASLTAVGYNPFSWSQSLTDIRLDPGNSAFRVENGALIRNSDDTLICMALGWSATSCRVPDGVRVIGENAFICYWDLTDVELPQGLVELDDWCFGFCESLTALTLPDGLQSIGAYAFSDATALRTVDVPSSVTYIHPYAFDECDALTLRVRAGSYAETWCRENGMPYELSPGSGSAQTETQSQAASGVNLWGSGMNGIPTAGQSPSVVGRDSDAGRTQAGEPAGEGEPSAGAYAVSETEDGSLVITGYTGSARDVSIPASIDGRSVTAIGESAFQGHAEIESVTVPEGVTRIEATAFHGCAALTDVTLPGSLREIGRFAFAECGALREITLPEGLETLDSCAFLNCGSLVSAYLPSTLKSVAENPFALCERLDYIEMSLSGNASFDLIDGVLYDADHRRVIAWPAAMVKLTADVASDTREIGYAAFAFNPYVRGVRLPEGLERIDDMAFIACRTLRSVVIPEGTTGIGYRAFASCYRLESVTVPASVTDIGEDAFADSPNVTVITPPGSSAESYCLAHGIPVSR